MWQELEKLYETQQDLKKKIKFFRFDDPYYGEGNLQDLEQQLQEVNNQITETYEKDNQ